MPSISDRRPAPGEPFARSVNTGNFTGLSKGTTGKFPDFEFQSRSSDGHPDVLPERQFGELFDRLR